MERVWTMSMVNFYCLNHMESHGKEAKENNDFNQFIEIGFVEVCHQCDP